MNQQSGGSQVKEHECADPQSEKEFFGDSKDFPALTQSNRSTLVPRILSL